MRQLFIAAGVVVAMAAGWGAGGRSPEGATGVEDRVRTVAAAMSAITPKTMQSGIVLRSVSAEGATLVTQWDGVHDWRPTYSDDEMKRMISVGLCARAGSVVADGARLRFELTSPTGATLPPLTIDHCP